MAAGEAIDPAELGQARREALPWLRVVDCGVGMPPALISKFLAEFGAQVLAAPPPGDPTPDVYPAYASWRSRQEVRAQSGVSLGALAAELTQADVCIVGGESFPGLAAAHAAQELSAAYPRLVVLEITGYPPGLHAGRPAVDVLVQARSGLAFEHYSDRPLFAGFEPCLYGAVLQGLAGVFAALIDRERSGLGQVVSTSLYEGALMWTAGFWTDVERPTPYTRFIPPKDPHPMIMRCADGEYIHFVMGAPGSKLQIYQILGIDDPTVSPKDTGLPTADAAPRKFFGDYDLLEPYVRRWRCDDLVAAISAKGLPAVRVLPPGGCWDDAQIQINDVIDTDPSGNRHAGNPILFRRNDAAFENPTASEQPLAGMHVVDLGAYVAGPISSVALADLGADVIKVEQPSGDPSRVMFRSFNAANRGKRVIGLDIKSERGKRIALMLCARADVVTNNFRSGVSERLGYDAAALHRLKPNLVVLESSAWGPVGPKSQLGGFDPVAQAFTGLEYRAGGAGNLPLWSRTFVCDFTGGAIGAIATLAALYHRAVTGGGATLNAPLVNGGVFLLSELIQTADGRFKGAPALNAAQTGYHPAQALYRAADGWLAIAARGDGDAARLATALDLGGRLPASRAQWAHEEETLIAARFAVLRVDEALQRLASRHVWAEPCRRDVGNETMNDPALVEGGTVHVAQHPILGRIAEVGPLLRFSRSQRGAASGTPAAGEHTREILLELGLGQSEIDALYAERVVA